MKAIGTALIIIGFIFGAIYLIQLESLHETMVRSEVKSIEAPRTLIDSLNKSTRMLFVPLLAMLTGGLLAWKTKSNKTLHGSR